MFGKSVDVQGELMGFLPSNNILKTVRHRILNQLSFNFSNFSLTSLGYYRMPNSFWKLVSDSRTLVFTWMNSSMP